MVSAASRDPLSLKWTPSLVKYRLVGQSALFLCSEAKIASSGTSTALDISAATRAILAYGGQLSFMGGIDSASVDHPGWTPEEVAKEVETATLECGKHYFIPCASQGGPMSTFPGVYDTHTAEIDRQSKLQFK